MESNVKSYFDEIRKIDKFTVKDIRNKIRVIEGKRNIHVLHACISGSRSYGLENKKSDYDLKLIYADSPQWYFKLNSGPDMFNETDGIFDIVGFNLQKTIKFIIDSNADFQEIIRSPLQIDPNLEFYSRFRRYSKEFHNPIKLFYHYENFTKQGCREFFNEHVKHQHLTSKMIKISIHVMRCLMAKTLCHGYGDIPLPFGALLDKANIEPLVKREIREFFQFIEQYKEGDDFTQVILLINKLNEINNTIKNPFTPITFKEKDYEPIFNFHQRTVLRGYQKT